MHTVSLSQDDLLQELEIRLDSGQQLQDVPERSQASYAELLDTANEGLLVLNKENRIILTNKRIQEVLGFEGSEVISKVYF